VVDLESLEELSQDFIFSLFASSDIWVLGGIVDTLDVVDVNDSTLVFIKFLECLLN
jgi:hypothetical protein